VDCIKSALAQVSLRMADSDVPGALEEFGLSKAIKALGYRKESNVVHASRNRPVERSARRASKEKPTRRSWSF
jgi:hypothetical protein